GLCDEPSDPRHPTPRVTFEEIFVMLSLMIVSEDWFTRSLLKSAAEELDVFQRVVSVDDGYTALAETWDGVADGGAIPEIFLIDQYAMDASGERLVTELRADPATRHVFIAALTPSDSHRPNAGMDLVTPADALHPDLPGL